MNFNIRTGLLAAVALAAFVAGPSAADELDDDDVISGQFTQRGFDDGGRVRVRFWGRDTEFTPHHNAAVALQGNRVNGWTTIRPKNGARIEAHVDRAILIQPCEI